MHLIRSFAALWRDHEECAGPEYSVANHLVRGADARRAGHAARSNLQGEAVAGEWENSGVGDGIELNCIEGKVLI